MGLGADGCAASAELDSPSRARNSEFMTTRASSYGKNNITQCKLSLYIKHNNRSFCLYLMCRYL